jgi:YebC/PmpR family DNA-binding regulatory protein
MSGHSKWSSIKHKKANLDAKKSNLFTKLARNITIAAKDGGDDLETNFQLRMAVDKAKNLNMPKDNIERAIKKGTGELKSEQLENIVYEAYGPGKTGILISCLTDNRNRTHADIKSILNKNNGSLGSFNSVRWMFDYKGIITILKKNIVPDEEKQLQLIDEGVKDILYYNNCLKIICDPKNLQKIQIFFQQHNIAVYDAALKYIPREKIKINDKQKNQLEKLIDLLEENDDVASVYCNVM